MSAYARLLDETLIRTGATSRDATAPVEPSQVEPIAGREAEMIRNDAGGFAFRVDDWTALNRFLVLGTEGGTYYTSEKTLTLRNVARVIACLRADGLRVVREIVRVSDEGLAPKNDAALFALALAASFGVKGARGDAGACEDLAGLVYHDDLEAARAVRVAALQALPRVARTGTHLMQFAAFARGLRGWGRGLKTAIGESYFRLPPAEKIALQVMKYGSRAGFTHRDLLRLSHPKPTGDAARSAVISWTLARDAGAGMRVDIADLDERLVAASRLSRLDAGRIEEAADLIRTFSLPREAVPDHFLKEAAIWDVLLETMPMDAMLRTLGRMSACGLLVRGSEAEAYVASRLADADLQARARLHPIKILIALKTYAQGAGVKGSLTWTPASGVTKALDRAFYASFRNLEASGKSFLFALDVSGSMGLSASGTVLSCMEAAMAMAMAAAASEPRVDAFSFSSSGYGRRGSGLDPIDLSKRRRLDDAVRSVMDRNWGGTDCSLPMLHALETGMAVDTFVVFTDNETWAGRIHPAEALARYREKTGIPARLVVVGMTASEVSIADPQDAGMLDVAGFDAALPGLISAFAAGRV